MAKILITFLGSARVEKNNGIVEVKYRTVNYRLGQRSSTTSFISEGLFKENELFEGKRFDQMIMIGTMGSMWERFYSEMSDEFDKKYFEEIQSVTKIADSQTPLNDTFLKRLSKELNWFKPVIIPYGISNEHFDEMTRIILQLKDGFESYDEISLDITHGFRSVPYFAFQLLNYMQAVGKPEGLKIDKLYYAQLESINELGHAPVVELDALKELTDWISSAHSMVSQGNGMGLANLLSSINSSIKSDLENLSRAIHYNHLPQIRIYVDAIQVKIKNYKELKDYPLAEMILPDTLDKLEHSLGREHGVRSILDMIQWNLDHFNLTNSLLMIGECVYECYAKMTGKVNNQDLATTFKREAHKYAEYKDLVTVHHKISEIRNTIAHVKTNKSFDPREILDISKDTLRTLELFYARNKKKLK